MSATSTGGAGERVFKIVSFYLLRYPGGRLDDLPRSSPGGRESRWLPLAEAPRLLAYRGERDMADKAVPAWLSDL